MTQPRPLVDEQMGLGKFFRDHRFAAGVLVGFLVALLLVAFVLVGAFIWLNHLFEEPRANVASILPLPPGIEVAYPPDLAGGTAGDAVESDHPEVYLVIRGGSGQPIEVTLRTVVDHLKRQGFALFPVNDRWVRWRGPGPSQKGASAADIGPLEDFLESSEATVSGVSVPIRQALDGQTEGFVVVRLDPPD